MSEKVILRPLGIPPVIAAALAAGATLAISLSGGKDGQAMLAALVAAHRAYAWPGALVALHADLGRVEWPESGPHCERLCAAAGVPLQVVRRPKGDLLARWQERMAALAGTGKPFWSSAQNRYCTSDLKRGPLDTALRQWPLVISAEGLRAEEGPDRAKKPVVGVRRQITRERLKALPPAAALDAWQQRRQGRLALNWRPILDWTLDAVWAACGTSAADLARRQRLYQIGATAQALAGWPAHPAYVYGNRRVSCMLCVLAAKSDLVNGARHNPALYAAMVRMEAASGCRFRADLALADLPVAAEEQAA